MGEKLGFGDGFRLAFSNIKYVKKHKKLFVLGIIPSVVAIIVGIFLFSSTLVVANYIANIFAEAARELPFADIISLIAWSLSFILGLIVVLYAFKIVFSLLTAPFNLGITKQVFSTFDGEQASLKEGFFYGLKKIFPCMLKEIIYEVFHFVLMLLIGVIMGFFHAVPILGSLLWFVAQLYVVWIFMGIEYLLYPFAIKEKNMVTGIVKTFQAGYKHHAFFAGLGLAYFIILFIPFLNALLIPVMIVSSVRAYKKIAE